MITLWPVKKKKVMRDRFKITYQSKAGTKYHVVVDAKNEDKARRDFLNFFSSGDDEIIEIVREKAMPR